MTINTYYLQARLSPTILTLIPVLSVYWYFISLLVSAQIAEVPYLPIVGDITLSATIVFILNQVNRFISKEIFQRVYFKGDGGSISKFFQNIKLIK